MRSIQRFADGCREGLSYKVTECNNVLRAVIVQESPIAGRRSRASCKEQVAILKGEKHVQIL